MFTNIKIEINYILLIKAVLTMAVIYYFLCSPTVILASYKKWLNL